MPRSILMGLAQSCPHRHSANEADGPWIAIGDLVLLKSLSQTELNGQRARIIPPHDGVPAGQVGVQLEASGKQLSVRVQNLEFLGAKSKTASKMSSATESCSEGAMPKPAATPSSLEKATFSEVKMGQQQTSTKETKDDYGALAVGTAVLLRDLSRTELNGQRAHVILATDPKSEDRVGVQLESSGKRVTVKARNLESLADISDEDSNSLSRNCGSVSLTKETVVDCTASPLDSLATPLLDEPCSDASSYISVFGCGTSTESCKSVCNLETVSQAKRRRKEDRLVKRLAAIEASILDMADHQWKANNRLQSLEDVAKRIKGDPLSELCNGSVASIADQLTEIQVSMELRMHRIECLLFASDHNHFHQIDQVLRGITNAPEQQEETSPIAQPDPALSPSRGIKPSVEDVARDGEDKGSIGPPLDLHTPLVKPSTKKSAASDPTDAANSVLNELPTDSSEALHALQYGIDLFKMEQADAAIVSFTAGLELLSKTNGMCDEHLRAVFLSNRAFVYSKSEKLADALQDLDVVLGIEEKNAEARYRRALIRFELGMVQDALSDIKIVLAESDNPLARKLYRQILGQ